MHRTAGLFLSLILLISLLFLSSCEEEEGELSYIDYDGTRYFVSSAVYHINDLGGDYDRWNVEVGTGDMVYITGQNYWSGSGLLLTAEMNIAGDDFDGVYVSHDDGNLSSLDIYPDYLNTPEATISLRLSEELNKVTVSETGGLFVVDFFVMMDDPPESNVGQPLTGRFIGSMTDLGTEYVIGPNPEE